MAKVIQSDNAVVDYSTIQTLIDTVNNLSDAVDKINTASKTKDATGKTVSQLVDSGNVQVASGSLDVKVTFNKTFIAKPDITATLMGGTKAMTVHIKNWAALTNTSATFTLSEAATSSTKLYWIAVGNGAA
jgi:hypothetical protein